MLHIIRASEIVPSGQGWGHSCHSAAMDIEGFPEMVNKGIWSQCNFVHVDIFH